MIRKQEKFIRTIQKDDLAKFKNYISAFKKSIEWNLFLGQAIKEASKYGSLNIINFLRTQIPTESANMMELTNMTTTFEKIKTNHYDFLLYPFLHLSDLSVSVTNPLPSNYSFELFDPLIPYCDFHVLYKLRITSKYMRHYINQYLILLNYDEKMFIEEAITHSCPSCIKFFNRKIAWMDPDILLMICTRGLPAISNLPRIIISPEKKGIINKCVSVSQNHILRVQYRILKYIFNNYPKETNLEFFSYCHLSDVDVKVGTPVIIRSDFVCWTIISEYVDHHSLCKLRLTSKTIRHVILNTRHSLEMNKTRLMMESLENCCRPCIKKCEFEITTTSSILETVCRNGLKSIQYLPKIRGITESIINRCICHSSQHQSDIQYHILKHLSEKYDTPTYFDSRHLADLKVLVPSEPETEPNVDHIVWNVLLPYFDPHIMCKLRLTSKSLRQIVLNHKYDFKDGSALMMEVITNNCISCVKRFNVRISSMSADILLQVCERGLSCIRYFPKINDMSRSNIDKCVSYSALHRSDVKYHILKYLFDNYRYPVNFDMFHLEDLAVHITPHSEYFADHTVWSLVIPFFSYHSLCKMRLTSKSVRRLVLNQKINFAVSSSILITEAISNACSKCIKKINTWNCNMSDVLDIACERGFTGIKHITKINRISESVIETCIKKSLTHRPRVMYQLLKYLFTNHKYPNNFNFFHLGDLNIEVSAPSDSDSCSPVWKIILSYLDFHSLCRLRLVSKSIRDAQAFYKYNFDISYPTLAMNGILNNCRLCMRHFSYQIQQMGHEILEEACQKGLCSIQYFPIWAKVNSLILNKCISDCFRHGENFKRHAFKYFLRGYDVSDKILQLIITDSITYDPYLFFEYTSYHNNIDQFSDRIILLLRHAHRIDLVVFLRILEKAKYIFLNNKDIHFPSITRYDKYVKRLGKMAISLYPELLWAMCAPSLLHSQTYCDDMLCLVSQPVFGTMSSRYMLASLIAWKDNEVIMNRICHNLEF